MQNKNAKCVQNFAQTAKFWPNLVTLTVQNINLRISVIQRRGS